MSINTKLLELAQQNVDRMMKEAFTPTQPDPAAGAAANPMDPAAAAQMDPAASGTAPGQVPPPAGDPAAQQAMGGQMPAPEMPQTQDPMLAPPDGMAPAQPQAAGVPQAPGGKPKFDPLTLEYRLYNMQQMLTAIANYLGVTIPISALIMPPGTAGAPPAEAALPGGAQDVIAPDQQQQQGQEGGIQPMADAGAAAGPVMPIGKTASQLAEEERQFADLLADIWSDPSVPKPIKSASDGLFDFPVTLPKELTVDPNVYTAMSTSAAIAAMLRAQSKGNNNV